MERAPTRDHHYLPVTYLRQWCGSDGKLWRSIRIEYQDKLDVRHRKFDSRQSGPRGVGYEPDLNTLPARLLPGQLGGDELEHVLGLLVDNRFPELRTRICAVRGVITDAGLLGEARRLLAAFVSRHPAQIKRAQAGGAAVQSEHATQVEVWRDRAATPKGRAALDALLDPHDPARQARSMVRDIATGTVLPGGALLGDVHVAHVADVRDRLEATGVDHFVTFDQAVIAWEANEHGLALSFALSPDVLVLVFEPGRAPGADAYGDAAMKHTIAPLPFREMLITRSEPRGNLRRLAESSLIPSAR